MVTFGVEYLKELGIIKKCRDLFGEFTGLDLEILNIDQKPLCFPCRLKNRRDAVCGKSRSVPCGVIRQDIAEELISSRKPQHFICPGSMKKIVVPLSINGDIIGILFAGENDSTQMDKVHFYTFSKLLHQLATYIIENETRSLRHFKTNLFTYRQQTVQRVVKYILDHGQQENLSLSQVASDNAISYCYLSHLFKNELKTTFVDFRRKVKMDFAARLLKNFGLTINQVSASCGFDDSSYFCKVFRKVYGCSALHFRKRIVSSRRRGGEQKFTVKRQFAPLSECFFTDRLISVKD
jgi:AraC-like DNA-binding protein